MSPDAGIAAQIDIVKARRSTKGCVKARRPAPRRGTSCGGSSRCRRPPSRRASSEMTFHALGDDMKALLCTRLGGPDDLEIGNLADPVAGPDEAVVRVEAAALNFFDTLIISGRYQTK